MQCFKMKLGSFLFALTVPAGFAAAQDVATAKAEAERSLEAARTIIDRLGRPVGPQAQEAHQAGSPAREEPASSWAHGNGARLAAASAAAAAPQQPRAATALLRMPSQASTNIATVDNKAATAKVGKTAANASITTGARTGGSSSGTKMVANGEDITTISRDGSAVTEIGAGDDVGNTSVSAENIVTIGKFGDTSATRIGTCSGTVRANGVYTEGGTTEICAGQTSRDGKPCLEVYRNTCIIHWYIRPKKSPCAPGYWTELRKCRLPSDTRHAIYRN